MKTTFTFLSLLITISLWAQTKQPQKAENKPSVQAAANTINLTSFTTTPYLDELGMSCKFSESEVKYNAGKFLCGFGILWENDHNVQICVISVNNKLITLKADLGESSMWDAKFKDSDYSVYIANQKDVRGGEGFDVFSADLMISDLKNGAKVVKKGIIYCAY